MTRRAQLDDATRVTRFFRECLTHSKGEHAGAKFELLDWQADFLRRLFGTKRPDGLRQYRQAYLEIPRKNGKSTLGAGIALYLLLMDREAGAEIYSAAADADQAALVFAEAKSMVESNPDLAKRCQVYRRAIAVPSTGSIYKVLSAEAYSKHGLNAHGIIFDEVHAQPTRELWDVLNTSTGARRQPLTIAITTAGFDRESLCWHLHEHARRVLLGELRDDSILPLIYAADADDDWTDPQVWAKANPSLGITIKPEYMQTECERAKMMPTYENTFRRLHLNQWTENETRWLRMEDWNACDSMPIDRAALRGARCFAGLDLSSKVDLTALVLYFPDTNTVLPFFWMPADNIRRRAEQDRVPYDQWVRAGFIEATEGNVVDQQAIRSRINKLASEFSIVGIGFDPWNATQMSQWLQEDGATVWELRQGFRTLSEPTKEFERLVVSRAIRHGGNPVLRWMVGNVIVRQDENGNYRPDKAKSRGRIDGVVAAVMAISRAIGKDDTPKPSVYKTRGLVTL